MSEQVLRRGGRGSIGAAAAADVAYLSGSMFAGGSIDQRDAADLIAFDQMVAPGAAEWAAFFINAIASHLLEHTAPVHAIDAAKAEWLIGEMAPAGVVESPRGLPLLMRVMEGARSVAPVLPAFALGQMRNAIITGEGPASAGRAHFSRVIDSGDVAMLRRILTAGGGGEGRPVSREEAEALFDIHDATIEATNDPEFAPLFVRAIIQHVRAASGLGVGARASALQPATPASHGGARLALDLLSAAGYQPDLGSLVEPMALSPITADWLAERLLRDGRASPATQALRQLLVGVTLAGSLRAMLDRAA